MAAALEGGEWSAVRPGSTLPLGKTRYPFYRGQGGLQGRSGRAENFVPIGIRSQTVKPVAQSLHPLSYPAHRVLLHNCAYAKQSQICIDLKSRRQQHTGTDRAVKLDLSLPTTYTPTAAQVLTADSYNLPFL